MKIVKNKKCASKFLHIKKIEKDSKIIAFHCAIYDQSSRPWDENASSNSTQLGEILSGVEFAVKFTLFLKKFNMIVTIENSKQYLVKMQFHTDPSSNICIGIPWFTLLMWGLK